MVEKTAQSTGRAVPANHPVVKRVREFLIPSSVLLQITRDSKLMEVSTYCRGVDRKFPWTLVAELRDRKLSDRPALSAKGCIHRFTSRNNSRVDFTVHRKLTCSPFV